MDDLIRLLGLSALCLLGGSTVIAADATAESEGLDEGRDVPTLHLRAAESPVAEGRREAAYVLELSEPSDRPIVVLYSTISGTAVAGSDFVEGSGAITIPAGDTTAELRIALLDDDVVEDDETFRLYLSASPAAAVLATARLDVAIADDDHRPQPNRSAEAVNEAEGPAGSRATAGNDGLDRNNRIVIHFNDSVAFEDVRSVQTGLKDAGYPLPELRSVGFEISRTNIRYFFEDDHDNASDVDRLVRGMTGASTDGPGDFTHYSPSPVFGTIEVWIAGDR